MGKCTDVQGIQTWGMYEDVQKYQRNTNVWGVQMYWGINITGCTDVWSHSDMGDIWGCINIQGCTDVWGDVQK